MVSDEATQLCTKDGAFPISYFNSVVKWFASILLLILRKSTTGTDHIFRSVAMLGFFIYCFSFIDFFHIWFPPGKSTIGPDHIYRSVETLGFKEDWKKKLDTALAEYKESEKNRPKMKVFQYKIRAKFWLLFC